MSVSPFSKVLASLTMRFIKTITFVDLPIRKKFKIFSGGVLFWFVVLFLIAAGTLLSINSKSALIVGTLLPQGRVVQTIDTELRALRGELSESAGNTEAPGATRSIELAKTRLNAVNSSLGALDLGGIGAESVGEQARVLVSAMAAVTQRFNGLAERTGGAATGGDLDGLRAGVAEAIVASDKLSGAIAKLSISTNERIGTLVRYALGLALAVLVLAAGLQLLFTKWIANSIADPVGSIIDQIHTLGTGDVDLSNKILITSKDDIGVLSSEFNHLMESIHKMTMFKRVIEEDDSLDDVYSRLGKVFQEVGIYEYMIYDVPTGGSKMKAVYPQLLPEQSIACDVAILDNCNLCKAKKTAHTISSTAYPDRCKMFVRGHEREHVCLPMLVGGNAGGVVQFMFEKPGDDRDAVDVIHKKVLEASQYVKESQSVIEAKRLMGTLRDSALNDSLTGLRNRRFLQEYAESLVAGALRRGKCTALIMCDIDYFKQVNDTHGHTTGDAILKETANIIGKSIRAADILIRFGGEEFLAVLLDVTEGESTAIAEKIRQNVEKAKFKLPEGILQKTISLGVSEFPTDTKMFWQAIKFADVALYKAKESGRNRSIRFTSEMWTGERF